MVLYPQGQGRPAWQVYRGLGCAAGADHLHVKRLDGSDSRECPQPVECEHSGPPGRERRADR